MSITTGITSGITSPILNGITSISSYWSTTYDTPPNIQTNYTGWVAWVNKRQLQFRSHCQNNRATNYYFSQSGNDTTGNGTIASPYKTIAKAAALISASSGNIGVFFKYDDMWREAGVGIDTSKTNVTVSSYGSGTNKPFFNNFTQDYTMSSWESDVSFPNTWETSETNTIAWVRKQSDRLGDTAGGVLSKQSTKANCNATSNSWFWDSGANKIVVNLNGGDPNSIALEGCISNTACGVALAGDGSYCYNIRADGYGMSTLSQATQAEGIKSRTEGNNAVLFENCEAYYASSHAIAHYAGSGTQQGGKAMFINCIGGLTNYNSGGETVMNGYSRDGGQEIWWINSQAAYGTLPDYNWTFASKKKRGIGFYGHTSGGANKASLVVVYNCSLPNKWSQPGKMYDHSDVATGDGTITGVRHFAVNCTLNSNAQDGESVGIAFVPNGVNYANKYYIATQNGTVTLSAKEVTNYNWSFNNYYEFDATSNNTTGVSMINAPGVKDSNNNKIIFVNNQVYFKGNANVFTFSFDGDVSNDSHAPPDATCDERNSFFMNNIFAYENTQAGGGNTLSMYNYGPNLKNNSIYRITNYSNQVRGYNNDANLNTAGSLPVFGTSQSQFLNNGATDYLLSHDINGKARTASPPDRGPVDWSS